MSTISDQFLTNYDTYKNDYSNVNLTSNAKECCDVDSSKSPDYCGEELYRKGENDANCQKAYKKYCETSFGAAKTDKCTVFCSKESNDCNTDRFKQFCDKLSYNQFKNNSKLCGCFGSDQFYKDIRNKMSTKYNIPIELLSDDPKCFYPKCKGSPFINHNTSGADCSTVNLSKCIQNVDFKGDNVEADNLIFKLQGNCETDIKLNTDHLKAGKDNDIVIPGNCDCIIDNKNLFYVFIGAGVLFLIFICIAIYMFLK